MRQREHSGYPATQSIIVVFATPSSPTPALSLQLKCGTTVVVILTLLMSNPCISVAKLNLDQPMVWLQPPSNCQMDFSWQSSVVIPAVGTNFPTTSFFPAQISTNMLGYIAPWTTTDLFLSSSPSGWYPWLSLGRLSRQYSYPWWWPRLRTFRSSGNLCKLIWKSDYDYEFLKTATKKKKGLKYLAL